MQALQLLQHVAAAEKDDDSALQSQPFRGDEDDCDMSGRLEQCCSSRAIRCKLDSLLQYMPANNRWVRLMIMSFDQVRQQRERTALWCDDQQHVLLCVSCKWYLEQCLPGLIGAAAPRVLKFILGGRVLADIGHKQQYCMSDYCSMCLL